MRILDTATFEGELAAGTSTTLTVDTSATEAETVLTFVDDGTQDGVPPQYDLTQRLDIPEGIDGTRWYDSLTGSTARSITDPAYGQAFEAEFSNTEGVAATYRITLVCVGGD